MPTWTDIGGFWISAAGFIFSIIIAVVAWVQARGAKDDAKIAKEQADAAKRIADEAQRQTAAAEAAAEAARDQAEAAIAALDWETIPQMRVVASRKHNQMVIDGRARRRVDTSEWYVVNDGKAAALRLSVRLNFGTNAVVALGPNSFAKLDGGQVQPLGMFNVPMPAFEDLVEAGHTPTARLIYDTPTGQKRDETKDVVPRER